MTGQHKFRKPEKEAIEKSLFNHPIKGYCPLWLGSDSAYAIWDDAAAGKLDKKQAVINILEEMKAHNVKNLVMASSSSVYGNCKEVPFKENMIVDFAISPYAATKKANEVMTHVYHKLFDMNVIMLRFFTVYGPKQRPDLAINKFTRLMLEDKEIPMFGDGTTSRDYTYIDDIVEGIIRSCNYVENNNDVYEILNLGNSSPVSLKEMINTIGQAIGVEPKIKQLPMQPGDVDRTFADISKAKKLIGYYPKTSFKEGIERFIKWYKENIKLYK
jgi:UDP-glucuronate 4-epimerase